MNTYKYTVGGSLSYNDPTYTERPADKELLEFLRISQSCYILNSKQMGKSSLVIRAKIELEKDNNVICILVDLEAISKNSSEEIWYESFVGSIMDDQKIPDFDWEEEWNTLKGDPLRKLKSLLNKILELTNKKHLILMLDEIDHLRLLNFNIDSLFNYIRFCNNDYRANPSKSNRITFCLIGTGKPSDFIEDNDTISFNIGEKIELRGLEFNREAIDKLSPGLLKKIKNETLTKLILQEIFKWTNGQPFLTQLLCENICKLSEYPKSENDVGLFVENCVDKYIEKWLRKYPEHRDFIENRIKKTKAQSIHLLERYKEILEKRVIPAAKNYNYEDMELRLSGLVIPTENGEHLQPFNRIYEKVFGLDWVNKKLADEISVRPYADQFNAWLQAEEEIKGRYLLYDIELKNAQTWQKENPKKCINDDITFLKNSEQFCQRVESSFPENCDYQAFIKILCSWTGGIKLFNDLMCKWAKDKRLADPENGQEKIWFETKLVPRLEDNEEVKKHCQEISDRLLNDPDIDPSLLLSSYKEILEQEEVEFNESRPEHQKLIDMRLVMKEDNKLRILCKIYRRIFNQNWVNQKNLSLIESLVSKELKRRNIMSEDSQSVVIVSQLNEFRLRLEEMSKAPYPYIIEILNWTAGNPNLTPLLCDFICNSISQISDEQVERSVADLIEEQIIKNCEAEQLKAYLENIFDTICDKFWLLRRYLQISLGEGQADNSLEVKVLEKFYLVKKDSNGKLEVDNLIYQKVFDEDYVNKELEKLRPYAKPLLKWIDSREELNLLPEQDLKKALTFVNERQNYAQMKEPEHEFMIASLVSKHRK